MDVREKLVELLKTSPTRNGYTDLEDIADHLLANGATVQEWISADDRLPDAAQGMEGVLGFVNGYNGRITFTDAYLFVKYDYAENVWWSEDYNIEGCKVTHWLPLPEPPKGE